MAKDFDPQYVRMQIAHGGISEVTLLSWLLDACDAVDFISGAIVKMEMDYAAQMRQISAAKEWLRTRDRCGGDNTEEHEACEAFRAALQ